MIHWYKPLYNQRYHSYADDTLIYTALQSKIPQLCLWYTDIRRSAVTDTTAMPTIHWYTALCSHRYHSYADDTLIYTALQSTLASNFNTLSNCTAVLQYCFWNSDLFYPDKFMLHSLVQRWAWEGGGVSTIVLPGAGYPITLSQRLKITHVILDSTLSFDDHDNEIVRASFNYHLLSLCSFRHSVTQDITSTLACSITGLPINNCNALLY